jgi:hypothetical protein
MTGAVPVRKLFTRILFVGFVGEIQKVRALSRSELKRLGLG